MREKYINHTQKFADFESSARFDQKYNDQSSSFRFFNSSDCATGNTIAYRRRDFYKISLLKGDYIVHYGDESISVSGLSLSFFSPLVPYTIEVLKEEENAGFIIFTELYYDSFFKSSISLFPLFNGKNKPIYNIPATLIKEVENLFYKIEKQSRSAYVLKDDMIRNHINELMHIAHTLTPVAERNHKLTSKERLYTIFNELLERQFPIDSSKTSYLRTASDFAALLHVHVNYLNRILKEVTGKTTSTLLYERLLKESIILLKHTNWSISEISFSLGFKDVSHFNHFFRKQTNATPSTFRS
jgi:AraC family transcriptional activator of pobA